ncbi:hypothetical protein SELMODRAFT_432529, partial [Selaginella moellendorffii]
MVEDTQRASPASEDIHEVVEDEQTKVDVPQRVTEREVELPIPVEQLQESAKEALQEPQPVAEAVPGPEAVPEAAEEPAQEVELAEPLVAQVPTTTVDAVLHAHEEIEAKESIEPAEGAVDDQVENVEPRESAAVAVLEEGEKLAVPEIESGAPDSMHATDPMVEDTQRASPASEDIHEVVEDEQTKVDVPQRVTEREVELPIPVEQLQESAKEALQEPQPVAEAVPGTEAVPEAAEELAQVENVEPRESASVAVLEEGEKLAVPEIESGAPDSMHATDPMVEDTQGASPASEDIHEVVEDEQTKVDVPQQVSEREVELPIPVEELPESAKEAVQEPQPVVEAVPGTEAVPEAAEELAQEVELAEPLVAQVPTTTVDAVLPAHEEIEAEESIEPAEGAVDDQVENVEPRESASVAVLEEGEKLAVPEIESGALDSMHATDPMVEDTQRASPASEDIHEVVEDEQSKVDVPQQVSEREVELPIPVEQLQESAKEAVQEPQPVAEAVPGTEAVPEAAEELAQEVELAEPLVAQVPTTTVDAVLPAHEEIEAEESIEPAEGAVDDQVENVEPRESASVAVLEEGEKLAVPEIESGAPDSMHATDPMVEDTQRASPASEDIHEVVEDEQTKVDVPQQVSEREVELPIPVEELPESANEVVQEPQPVAEAVPGPEAVPEAAEEPAQEVELAEPLVAQVPTATVDAVLPAHKEIEAEESIEPAEVAVDDQVENVEPRESASVAILEEGEKLAVPEIDSGAPDSISATDPMVEDTQGACPASEDIHELVEEEQIKFDVPQQVSEREVELPIPVEELPESANEVVQEPQPVAEAVPGPEAVPEAAEEPAQEVELAEPLVAQEIEAEESIEPAEVAVDDQVENVEPRESASVAILEEGEKLAVPEIDSGAPDSISATDPMVEDTQGACPASEDIHELVEEEQIKFDVPQQVSEREVELPIPVEELAESANEVVQEPQPVAEAVPGPEAVPEAAEEPAQEVELAEPLVAQVPTATVDAVLPAHKEIEAEESIKPAEVAVDDQEPEPVAEAVPGPEAVPEAAEEPAQEVELAEPLVAQVPTATVDAVLPAHEEIEAEESIEPAEGAVDEQVENVEPRESASVAILEEGEKLAVPEIDSGPPDSISATDPMVEDTQGACPASEDIHELVEEEQTKVDVPQQVSEREVELPIPVEELPESAKEAVQEPEPVSEAVPGPEAVPEAAEEPAQEVELAEPLVAQVPTATVDAVLPAHKEIEAEESIEPAEVAVDDQVENVEPRESASVAILEEGEKLAVPEIDSGAPDSISATDPMVEDTQGACHASEDIHELVEEEQTKVDVPQQVSEREVELPIPVEELPESANEAVQEPEPVAEAVPGTEAVPEAAEEPAQEVELAEPLVAQVPTATVDAVLPAHEEIEAEESIEPAEGAVDDQVENVEPRESASVAVLEEGEKLAVPEIESGAPDSMHATDPMVEDTQGASPASEDIHEVVEEEQTKVDVPQRVSEREEVELAEPLVAQVPTATVDAVLPAHEEIEAEESIEPAEGAVDDQVVNVEPRESAAVAVLEEGEKLAVPEIESGAPDSMHATDPMVEDTQRASPASEDIHKVVEEEKTKVDVPQRVSEREVELPIPVEQLQESAKEAVQEPQPVAEAVPGPEAVPEAAEEPAQEVELAEPLVAQVPTTTVDAVLPAHEEIEAKESIEPAEGAVDDQEVELAEPLVAQVPTATVDAVLPAHEEIEAEESIEPAEGAVDDQVENVEPRESASVAVLEEGEKLAVPEIESGAPDSMHATDPMVEDTQRASHSSEDIHEVVEDEQTKVDVPQQVSEREVELPIPVEEFPESAKESVQEPQPVVEAVPGTEAVPEAAEELAQEVELAEPLVGSSRTITVDAVLPAHEEIEAEESIEPAEGAVDEQVENVEPRESASVAVLEEGEKLAVPEIESGAPDSMHATDPMVEDTQGGSPASEDIHEHVEEEEVNVEKGQQVSERGLGLAFRVEELPQVTNEAVQEPETVLEAVPEREAVPEAAEEAAKGVELAEPVAAQVPTTTVDAVLRAHDEIKEEESMEPGEVAVNDQ